VAESFHPGGSGEQATAKSDITSESNENFFLKGSAYRLIEESF
jgi:hypothetical protein